MKTQTLWLIGMMSLCVVLLGVAILVNNADTAAKVLAIVSIVIGSLVAVGTKLFPGGGGE